MAGSKPSWKICEDSKKMESEARGCKTFYTGIGSDFIEFCPEEKPTFVEVKEHCGDLTKMQKATKAVVTKMGFGYRVDRCSCPIDPVDD